MKARKGLSRPLRAHLLTVLGSLFAACIVGLIFGLAWQMMLAVALLHLGWQLKYFYRLHAWIAEGRGPPPHSQGLWDEIYARLHRLKKQSRTRKKRLTKVLKELRQATAALPDGIVVLDKNHHVSWANQSAGELLGIVKSQDAQRPVTNILRDAEVVNWLLLPKDKREDLIIDSSREPGRKLLLRLFPYAKGQVLLLARDITEILRAETMRKEFVANVSHELRTPLTVISGYVETMAEEAPDDWKPVVAKVEQQTLRMRAIVEDLLALSPLDASIAGNREAPVNVKSLLSTLMAEALALSEGRHDIACDIAAGLNLTGSAADLHSAFLNLVSNAVRYTPAGGTVKLRWYRDGEEAVFAVCDDGPGIAAQHLPLLTERFYRVSIDRSRESGGTGLGLAIVKHVLALHEASLEIDSTPGEGSEFRCRFPAARVTGHWAVDRAS